MARPAAKRASRVQSPAIDHVLDECWRRGWSRNELARQLELGSGTISRLLNGKFLPSLELALRIEDVLGVSPRLWLHAA
jgi:plasmid maintenance system antidote protein VapI